VNSGISAFIDANGRVVQKTEAVDPYFDPRPAESTLATLPLLEGGRTVYAKVGDLFTYLCALGTTFLLGRAVLSSRSPRP
jgi:apolipoprotein N-acyltransferase